MNFVKTLIFSAALLSFSFPNAFAQNLEEKGRPDLACRYIDLKMKEEPFKSGLTGVLAVTLDGDTLISRNSLGKMIPASNTKLISTGLAIHGLGAATGLRPGSATPDTSRTARSTETSTSSAAETRHWPRATRWLRKGTRSFQCGKLH